MRITIQLKLKVKLFQIFSLNISLNVVGFEMPVTILIFAVIFFTEGPLFQITRLIFNGTNRLHYMENNIIYIQASVFGRFINICNHVQCCTAYLPPWCFIRVKDVLNYTMRICVRLPWEFDITIFFHQIYSVRSELIIRGNICITLGKHIMIYRSFPHHLRKVTLIEDNNWGSVP